LVSESKNLRVDRGDDRRGANAVGNQPDLAKDVAFAEFGHLRAGGAESQIDRDLAFADHEKVPALLSLLDDVRAGRVSGQSALAKEMRQRVGVEIREEPFELERGPD